MIGLGTIINSAAIVAGGLVGLFSGKLLKERFQETLQLTCGVSVLVIGIAGAMEKMLSIKDGALTSGYSIMITVCLVLGAVLGEIINIEQGFEHFGEWLKKKTKSTGDSRFVDGFAHSFDRRNGDSRRIRGRHLGRLVDTRGEVGA